MTTPTPLLSPSNSPRNVASLETESKHTTRVDAHWNVRCRVLRSWRLVALRFPPTSESCLSACHVARQASAVLCVDSCALLLEVGLWTNRCRLPKPSQGPRSNPAGVAGNLPSFLQVLQLHLCAFPDFAAAGRDPMPTEYRLEIHQICWHAGGCRSGFYNSLKVLASSGVRYP